MMQAEEKRLAEELLFSEEKSPGFAKQLFFGHFDHEGVCPFPHPIEDENFIASVRDFVNNNIDPAKIDQNAQIPDRVIKGLAKLGVLGMTVPKEYSGLGMSQHAYCRVLETLASKCASTALFVSVHQSIGLKGLVLYGTEEQKTHWLPLLAAGKSIAAFALTEPNAGSDVSAIETRAVYNPKTKTYRIDGQKQWITNGGIADILTVMAKTEIETPRGKEERVTAFLVTPDMPGFIVTERNLEKLGMRGTWTATLAFEGMEVPETNILGPLGGGLKVCLTVLDYGRTAFGAICTGVAKDLATRATQHAIDRHQFHRSLGTFPLIKKKLAKIHTAAYAIEATTYLTAGLIDNHTEDFMLEAAILKVYSSEALWESIYETMQIFGGRSFFTDAPFERIMRDARLNMIGEGANEVLRAFIAAVGMRDVGVELQEGISHYSKWMGLGGSLLRRIFKPTVPIVSKVLQDEADMLAVITKRFAWAVIKLLGRYREDIIERQLQLDRVASIAIALYTSTAVLSRLDTDLTQVNKPADSLAKDLATGKFYCQQTLGMARRFLREMDHNLDNKLEQLSDTMTGLEAK